MKFASRASTETWVTGKAEATARQLRKLQNVLVTTYKKFGLTLNQIIFLAMLVLIPAIQFLWQRVLFVAVVILLLRVLLWLHQRFIPNTTLYLSEEEPSAIQVVWPTILSSLAAATASLAAALLFWWLTK